MKKTTLFKSLLLMAVFALGSGNVWAETTIVITVESVGGTAVLGTNAYNSGAEKTWSQSGVSFGGKAITANRSNTPSGSSSGTFLQTQANNGVIYNTTPIPGKITSITLMTTAGVTERASSCYGGTSRLVNDVTGDYIVAEGTQAGESSTAGWGIADFSDTNYTYFAIKRGAETAYWTQIVITYEETASNSVVAPVIDISGEEEATDVYWNNALIALSTTTEGASIHYTTNDNEPTESSTLYENPFTITTIGTTTIKAMAVKSGLGNSTVAEKTFTIAEKPIVPVVSVAEETIPAIKAEVGKAATEEITVSGLNLTDDIVFTIEGTNSTLFTLSQYTISQTTGEATATTITITYSPIADDAPHTAILKINSTGAAEIARTLTGNIKTAVPDVIITEVYGGGGNTGAPYKNDYVELYNTTSSDIDISRWSLQYYTYNGTGSANNVFVFPENSIIEAEDYFLIQLAAGTNEASALPAPNATGTLALAGTNGKIILYTTNDAQTITEQITSITSNANFKDYVPYGTAIPIWGTALVALSNTTSASRNVELGVYAYTQDVGADFTVGTPNPQAGETYLSGTNTIQETRIYAVNGKINFVSEGGQTVEIYNVLGQNIHRNRSAYGLNSISVGKGVFLVKIGKDINKIIVK